jgi:hypothetical protein
MKRLTPFPKLHFTSNNVFQDENLAPPDPGVNDFALSPCDFSNVAAFNQRFNVKRWTLPVFLASHPNGSLTTACIAIATDILTAMHEPLLTFSLLIELDRPQCAGQTPFNEEFERSSARSNRGAWLLDTVCVLF